MEKRSVLISILIISVLVVSLSLIITVQEFTKSDNENNVVETGQVLLDAQQNNLGGLSGLSSLDNEREDDDNFGSLFSSSSGGGGSSSKKSDSGSSSSSSSSSSSDTDSNSEEADSSEADSLDSSSTEDSTTDLNNEESNPSDNFDSIDNDLDKNNPRGSNGKKSMIDDENEDFVDVIVMLKDDGSTPKIAMDISSKDSSLRNKLSEIKSKIKRKQDKVLSRLDSNEFQLKHRYKTVNGFAGKVTQEGWDKLEQDPNVKAIYENKLLNITLRESVPLINADDVWDLGITGEGSVVCVVDTGIDYMHRSLGGCTNVYDIEGNIVPYSLESSHPYPIDNISTWTITMEDYSNIAVHFERIGLETGYWDYIEILDSNNKVVQTIESRIPGMGYSCEDMYDVWSVSVPGDTIKIRLVSDTIYNTCYGFKIDKVLNGIVTFSDNPLQDCEKVIDGYDFVNDDNDPMDDNNHGTHVAGIIAANRGTTSDITTVGSWDYYSWTGQNRGRGNNWYISEDVTINEIEMYLGISSSTTLYWFVYEKPTATGSFTKIFETSTTSGTGEKFYSSDDINVELEAGKYYLIGVWWGATDVEYGRGNEYVPFDVSFGKLQTGLYSSLTGSTPPDTWSFTASGYPPYYGRITTSMTPFKGVAPDAKIIAVKVCDRFGGCWSDDMIAGVDWCNDHSSNIVATTMSIGDGGEYNSANCPIWMDDAINTAHDLGIAVTVASGNDYHSDGISYPACSPNAISVGSTTKQDVISGFTNTGILLDLLAPGSSIYSTIVGGYGTGSGTSMAAPFVAGAIALAKQLLPLASPDEIEDRLKSTGIPITDPDNGLSFPRIDLLAAVPADLTIAGAFVCPGDDDFCFSQDNPKAGENLVITFGIQNEGGSTLENIEYKIDTGPLELDIEVDTGVGLAPGKIMVVNAKFSYANAGSYAPEIILDPNDNIPELDETNNNQALSINVE